MNYNTDDIIAAGSGLVGGLVTTVLMDITWQSAWENLGHLLWVGFVAMFTGAMGVIGKHLIDKFLKRKKKPK